MDLDRTTSQAQEENGAHSMPDADAALASVPGRPVEQPWTSGEKAQLISTVRENGTGTWEATAATIGAGRTANSCKRQYLKMRKAAAAENAAAAAGEGAWQRPASPAAEKQPGSKRPRQTVVSAAAASVDSSYSLENNNPGLHLDGHVADYILAATGAVLNRKRPGPFANIPAAGMDREPPSPPTVTDWSAEVQETSGSQPTFNGAVYSPRGQFVSHAPPEEQDGTRRCAAAGQGQPENPEVIGGPAVPFGSGVADDEELAAAVPAAFPAYAPAETTAVVTAAPHQRQFRAAVPSRPARQPMRATEPDAAAAAGDDEQQAAAMAAAAAADRMRVKAVAELLERPLIYGQPAMVALVPARFGPTPPSQAQEGEPKRPKGAKVPWTAGQEELVKIRPPTRPHDGWTPEETDTLQKIVSRDGIPKTASAWEDLAAEYNRSVSSRRRTGGSLKQRLNRLKKAAESAGLAPAEYPPEYKGQGRAKQRAAEREKPKAMAMEENKPTKVALVGKWISIEYEVKHGKARWYKGQVHKYDASNDRYLVKEAPLPRPVPNPRLFLAVSPELNVWRKKNDTDCFALPWPDIVGDRWAGLGRFAPERRVQDGASARQAHSQDRTQGHTERGRPLWLHAISVATQ